MALIVLLKPAGGVFQQAFDIFPAAAVATFVFLVIPDAVPAGN